MTLELRLRAIRTRRRASRLAGVVKVSIWFVGLAAAVTFAGGTLVGSR